MDIYSVDDSCDIFSRKSTRNTDVYVYRIKVKQSPYIDESMFSDDEETDQAKAKKLPLASDQ